MALSVTNVQDSPIGKGAALFNCGIARTMSIGTSWDKIRVGALMSVERLGVTDDLTGTPRLAVGVSSGTTAPLGAVSATHFAGVISTQNTWEYDSSPAVYGRNGFTNGPRFRAAKFVAPTLTVSGSDIGSFSMSNEPELSKSLIIVDIEKGTTNWTMNMLSSSFKVDGDNNMLAKEMITMTEAEILAIFTSLSGGNTTLGTAQTVAVDENDGSLDTVNIFWGESNVSFLVHDVAYAQTS